MQRIWIAVVAMVALLATGCAGKDSGATPKPGDAQVGTPATGTAEKPNTPGTPGNADTSATGKGSIAIDLPPVTGDVQTDAEATLRKYYSLLNEKDFDNPRRLFDPSINMDVNVLNVKGITSYTYKSGELMHVEEEFQKTPGDTIMMKAVVAVETDGQIQSALYKPGDNTLLVRMVKGGSGQYSILQISSPDAGK